ncbi:MAG: DUF3048 domain-containing protein [Propionibacteriaceae bacterium]|jgi:Protein of unknown function (DUF3048) N-terminal domain/Protein of unknown function (DUF3048) C-terminal domain
MNRATIVAITAAAVLAAGGIGAAALSRPDSPPIVSSSTSLSAPPPTPSPTGPPTPRPRPADPLTGGKVSDNPVIAAKVENIAAARPQVGLSLADITFVEEVEGAQTRLIAVYHSRFPKRLGPVRSARSTDVQLLPLFGKPGLVYSGANSSVQRKINNASIVPIPRSTRDHSRVAPHNVFVNLAAIARSTKLGEAASIGWKFSDAGPRGLKTTSIKTRVGYDTFSFGYSSGRYIVRWNGFRYADGDTHAITKADNVVIMKVHNHPDGNRDVLGAPSVQSDTVGKGVVTIYRDGRKIAGQWKRTKASGPLRFTDKSGDPIPLKPGQTWVALTG